MNGAASTSTHPRVLLVEDNRPVRALLERALIRFGCDVDSVPDGRRALRAVRRSRPDLIVMDMRLPGMDGPEVLAKLRRSRGGGDLPVVAISGYGYEELRRRVRELGCVAFLEKPLKLDSLRQALGLVLGYRLDRALSEADEAPSDPRAGSS